VIILEVRGESGFKKVDTISGGPMKKDPVEGWNEERKVYCKPRGTIPDNSRKNAQG